MASIQKAAGILNPKPSTVPTVSIKGCKLVPTPTEELHPGSLKGRALLKSHSFPEVRDSEPPSW